MKKKIFKMLNLLVVLATFMGSLQLPVSAEELPQEEITSKVLEQEETTEQIEEETTEEVVEEETTEVVEENIEEIKEEENPITRGGTPSTFAMTLDPEEILLWNKYDAYVPQGVPVTSSNCGKTSENKRDVCANFYAGHDLTTNQVKFYEEANKLNNSSEWQALRSYQNLWINGEMFVAVSHANTIGSVGEVSPNYYEVTKTLPNNAGTIKVSVATSSTLGWLHQFDVTISGLLPGVEYEVYSSSPSWSIPPSTHTDPTVKSWGKKFTFKLPKTSEAKDAKLVKKASDTTGQTLTASAHFDPAGVAEGANQRKFTLLTSAGAQVGQPKYLTSTATGVSSVDFFPADGVKPNTKYKAKVEYLLSGDSFTTSEVQTSILAQSVSNVTTTKVSPTEVKVKATFTKGHSGDTEKTKQVKLGTQVKTANASGEASFTGLLPNTTYAPSATYVTTQNGTDLPAKTATGTNVNTDAIKPTISVPTASDVTPSSFKITATVANGHANDASAGANAAEYTINNGASWLPMSISGTTATVTVGGLDAAKVYNYKVRYSVNQGNVAPVRQTSAEQAGAAVRTTFVVDEKHVLVGNAATPLSTIPGIGNIDKTGTKNAAYTPGPTKTYQATNGDFYVYKGWRDSNEGVGVIHNTTIDATDVPKTYVFVYQKAADGFTFSAENFSYKLSNVGNLVSGGTDEAVDTLKLANVLFAEKDPITGVPYTAEANAASLSALKAKTQEGIYTLQFDLKAHNTVVLTKTVNVFLSDKDKIVIGTTHAIGANNIAPHSYVNFDDDAQEILTKSDAIIYNLTDGTNSTNVLDFIVTTTNYTNEVGSHTINLAADAEPTTVITIDSNVYNNKPLIDFTNSTGTKTETIPLDINAQAPVLLDGVSLVDLDEPGLTVTDLEVDGSVDTSIPGIYRVTYNFDDELKKQNKTGGLSADEKVRFYVVGPYVENADYLLTATSFEADVVQTAWSTTEVIEKANAKAMNKLTGAIESVSFVPAAFDGTVEGTHPLTFTVVGDPANLSTNIVAEMLGAGSIIDTKEKVSLSGYDVHIEKADLTNFHANVYGYTKVKANNKVTNTPIPNTAIEIDPQSLGQLAAITATSDPNVGFPVTFKTTVEDQSVEITIHVYLYDEMIGNIGWSGTNFPIELRQILEGTPQESEATAELMKQLSDVKATDMRDLDNIVAIDRDTIKVIHAITETGNGQQVQFETVEEPASKYEVKANVYDEYDETTGEGISAYDYPVALEDITDTTYEALAQELSYARAFKENGTALPDPLPTPTLVSPVPTVEGPHATIFTTANGLEKEVEAQVYSKGTVNPGIASIFANDFRITLDELQDTATNEQTMLDRSNVVSHDESVYPRIAYPQTDIMVDAAFMANLPTTPGVYPVTFVEGNHNTEVTVNMKVYSNGEILSGSSIFADSFRIALGDVSKDNFITAGQVEAYDDSKIPSLLLNKDNNDNIEILTALPTTVGNFPVTFEEQLGGAKVTVDVQVYDKGTIIPDVSSIYANNFSITIDDLIDTTNNVNTILSRSNVIAFDEGTYPALEQAAGSITIETSPLPDTVGTHQITFKEALGGAEVTVDMQVYEEGDIDAGVASIFANSFSVGMNELTEADFKNKSNVVAFDESFLPVKAADESEITLTSALPTTSGMHSATFAYKTVEVTVPVRVFSNGTETLTHAIYADNFVMSLDQVDVDNFKDAAGLEAYDKQTTPWTLLDRYQDTTMESPLPSRAGTWNVTFKAGDAEVTVSARIYTNGPIPPNPGVESIYADDFQLALNDVTVQNFFDYSNVIAFDETTLPWTEKPQSAITLVTPLPQAAGTYPVTFESGSVAVTVNVRIYTNGPVPPNPGVESIYADDFMMTLEEVLAETTNVQLALDRSNVIAFDETTNPWTEKPQSEISLETDLPTTAGTYPMTFKSGTVSTTVNLRVYTNGPIPPNPGVESIYADDFVMTLEEVQDAAINEQLAFERSNVIAFDETTNPWTEKPQSSISLITPMPDVPGTHAVTFESGSVQVTVNVRVYTDGPVPPNPGVESIYADNFNIMLDEVSEENFFDYSHVVAFDETTNPWTEKPQSDITLETELPEETGTYDVTFKSGTVSVTVTVNVFSGGIIDPGVESIFANDFEIPVNDITEAAFFTLSEVVAFDESTVPATEKPQSSITLETPLPLEAGIHDVTFKSGNLEITVKATVLDNIDNYDLYAEDATFKLSEINAAKNSGKLEEVVLERTKAKVTNIKTGKEFGPIHVDTKPLDNLKLKETNHKQVEVSFSITDKEAAEGKDKGKAATRGANVIEGDKMSREVTITVTDDTDYSKNLPITGEQIRETYTVGLLVTAISTLVIFFELRRRK